MQPFINPGVHARRVSTSSWPVTAPDPHLVLCALLCTYREINQGSSAIRKRPHGQAAAALLGYVKVQEATTQRLFHNVKSAFPLLLQLEMVYCHD